MRALQQWLDRFCLKHPRLGIPGLMRYIVIGNVLVYLLDMFSIGGAAAASTLLSFNRASILSGQVWRLITFIFVPNIGGRGGVDIFFFAILLYFYYFIGTSLEREWGSNKFTIFYGFGILLNIIVGFVAGGATMYYVNMSMFFAFATLYPDLQFLLFFLIPVKAKWLAWLDVGYFVVTILRLLVRGHFLLAMLPVVAILNYLLFFASDILDQLSYWKTRYRPRNTGTAGRSSGPKVVRFPGGKGGSEEKGYLHKCAVCGKTDVSDPQMEFRYCSKCNGYYCYCADHINTHIHIQ